MLREWLVTAMDIHGHFIDQRRIEAFSHSQAMKWAYDWIVSKGGSIGRSTAEEIR